MPVATPRYYFSFRSPYSWFATRLLSERYRDVGAQVRLVPYWEPGEQAAAELSERHGAKVLYAQMSKAKHLYILTDTKRMAAQLGYKMAWPVDRAPAWDVPHFAYVRAGLNGIGAPVMAELMAARWERGEDICQPDTIRRVAEKCAVEPEILLAAPGDPDSRAVGLSGLAEAYRQAVFGVPFFVAGRQRFWGVDRLALFVEAVRNADAAGRAPRCGGSNEPDERFPVGALDQDLAGGCG
jgi:2-hydroxychromene-2-carboxylate isomerase